MSVIQKQVSIVSSVDSFLKVAVQIVAEAKAGKVPAQIVGDALPALIAALGQVAELKADIADTKDLETTILLKLGELIEVFTKP